MEKQKIAWPQGAFDPAMKERVSQVSIEQCHMLDAYPDTHIAPKSPKLQIANAKVLVVGAGGIGCELLKTLVLTGFKNIEAVRPLTAPAQPPPSSPLTHPSYLSLFPHSD